jgi:Transposase DDE domain
MLKTISNAFEVVRTTLGKIKNISRPVSKFILHLLPLWLALNCRYVFTNFHRWGGRTEKSYRSMFCKAFDWFCFNYALIQQHFGEEIIAVFDPTYIKKSGKHTYGLAKFWSGTASRAMKGIELGCLCFVDVQAHTALHGVAVQSPAPASLHTKGKTLIDHYTSIVKDYVEPIKRLTRYIVVDGYFMKRDFIEPLLLQGLHTITKARSDANLRYLYKGQQKQRGRKRLYDAKINTGNVDKRRVTLLLDDKEKTIYTAIVYCVQLKRKVLAAFVYYKDKKGNKKKKSKPHIILTTDIEMKAESMCNYYSLRFQVEFLIRDGKQYAGLEHCQARSKQKLYNHFNLSMTAVAVAKAAYYLSLPQKERGSFSMADIKMQQMNELFAQRIFHNLDINLNCEKYQQAYENALNFGRLRA